MATITEKKMTQRDYFNALLALESVSENAELVEFINSRLAQLDKKSASSKGGERKPTAKQVANEAIKEAILENMTDSTYYSATDMLKQFDCFDENTTSQKVNALLRQMVSAGTVERVEEKRKTYFCKAKVAE